jgi:Undecaprenyl-phosphate glucose phosphotransferase
MLKQNSNILLAILVIFDLLFLILDYLASRYISAGNIFFSSWTIRETIVAIVIIFIFFIVLERFELSHSYRFRPLTDIIKNVIFYEMFIISMFYICTSIKIFEFNSTLIFAYIVISFIFLLFERVFIKIFLNLIRKSGFNYKRYLIIGAGLLGINFFEKVTKAHELGIKIVGFLDDNIDVEDAMKPGFSKSVKQLIIGKTDLIESFLKTKNIDNVIISLPMKSEEKIIDLINTCEKYGVKAELIPDYYKIISNVPSIRQVKGFPLIGIRNVPLENMFNRFLKRLVDLFFAIFGLVVCSPIFIIVMIGIKLTSEGPVFFKQKRTGFKQRDFYILKFRTMKVNKDSDIIQATKDDPRKTMFGNFLRRTNIDELPQLINILMGEMSIIGPRPHMLAHTEEFYQKYDKYHVRHWVKPGLTGWAQVNGWRGDTDIGVRVKYDIDYIENWSLWFDVKILFLTVFGKKVRKNAV